MRLHVGKFGAEEFANTLNGDVFNLVYHAASAIIAFARQSLGILVGAVGTHGFHHLVAYKILTRDELHAL